MSKKMVRRGEVLVGTTEPPPGSAVPTSAEGAPLSLAAGEARAGEPGCERKRDVEQVQAEVTCSLSVPACDLLPETQWLDGRIGAIEVRRGRRGGHGGVFCAGSARGARWARQVGDGDGDDGPTPFEATWPCVQAPGRGPRRSAGRSVRGLRARAVRELTVPWLNGTVTGALNGANI
ncbi:unnamed protein product [Prorocentrum cordatum]|uniref:Uncharacterized protein n=1 Tax=Prorocentrum cordatum TaxID=2364126 RepID=A0ABN9QWM9_9DINO|nr:unnamed protein product [Polarella glacialis]